ncbi:MAG: SAV_6107 family HEPN domain-containing protein [Actinomycetes bacterium]
MVTMDVRDCRVGNGSRESAARELFLLATTGLSVAAAAPDPACRFAEAHLAALRAGAAVVAVRAPASQPSRVTSVWALLARRAPELAEWAAFFEAGAAKRFLVLRGVDVVSTRVADDLLRDSVCFVGHVGEHLGFTVTGLAQVADRLVVSG